MVRRSRLPRTSCPGCSTARRCSSILASGKYLGLNEVATRVWELLGEAKAFGAIRAALLDEFEVPPDVLDRDLNRLFDEMQARGLIRAS